MTNKRTFLFLQGPNSFFFREFGKALASNGNSIKKINFCGGDNFFWSDNYCTPFTGKFEDWESFLKNLDRSNNFTDIILYGDCREYHKVAIKLFKDKKIHVFEEGYFRPDWITYELNGVNANSSLPRDGDFYKSLKCDIGSETRGHIRLHSGFKQKALYTCLHYVYRSFFDYKEYPNYVPHRKITPEEEGGAWFRKWLKSYFRKAKANFVQKKIFNKKGDFFLFALQLCSDSQIKEHSDFTGMRNAIDVVVNNFKQNCPEDIFLVIKTHPEEAGISKLSNKVKEVSKELSLGDRIIFIDGGNMPSLLKSMKGMVTVNSTATLSAIHHKKPVKCLGRAIYNFEGMTDQKPLDEFWKNPSPADEELFSKFRFYIHKNSQINGNFYSKEGIKLLTKNLLDKI